MNNVHENMIYPFEHSIDRLGKGAAFSRILPVLGHLAKGAKKGDNSRKPGADINEGFRFSIQTHPEFVYPILQKEFGIRNINTDYVTGGIPISLPFEDVYDNLWVGNREVTNTKGQIGHDCQNIPTSMRNVLKNVPEWATGIILYRVTFDASKNKHTETLYSPPEKTRIEYCDGKKCSPIILFRFHIRVGGLENYGVFGLSTSSIYDVNKIPKQLLYYDKVLREYGFPHGIRHIPLILERLEENVTLTTNKGAFRNEKWLLNIRVDPEFLKTCPIFSIPPLESFSVGRPNRRARISEHLQAKIDSILSNNVLPDNVVAYVNAVLMTGVYEKKRMIYPVTDNWVDGTLIPRLLKVVNANTTPEIQEEPERLKESTDVKSQDSVAEKEKSNKKI